MLLQANYQAAFSYYYKQICMDLLAIYPFITPVRDKFIMQIVLTALIFLHIPAVPLAYSHKSNMP